MTTTTTRVARITEINHHAPDGWFDTIAVIDIDADGNEDVIWAGGVESSDEAGPYDMALAAAGFGGVPWEDQSL